MTELYPIILIILITLIVNIFISLFMDPNNSYEENYLFQYYKLKNMPTIIPFDFEEDNYENYYINENYYYKNIDETDFRVSFNINNYNGSSKEFNYCYSLLNEFMLCLHQENENNKKCQKLFKEKMEDLEKCEMINFNNSIQEMKNNIVYFNLPNNEMNTDIEEEFSNEKKFNEITDFLDKKEKKKN